MMNREKGFTLIELIVASLLFSLVIAALSAIYATAFGQSGRAFQDSRTKLMATTSMRAIMREAAQATRIDLPGKDSSSHRLSGCANAKADSTRITTAQPSVRFDFCVRLTNRSTGLCDGDPDSAPCLFYYSKSVSGNCPVSDVNDSNCGNTLGTMGTPQMLASGLEEIAQFAAISPASGFYIFTREAGVYAQEDNAVRVAYNVTRPPGANFPKRYFLVDTTVSSQFGVRP